MEVWHFGDLGVQPFSTANSVSHAFEAEQTQHIFFVVVGEIYEIWWPRGGGATLAALTKGADAVGPITSHVFDGEKTQHVFYQAFDGHIYELWWRGGEVPHQGKLTAGNGAPLAATSFAVPAMPLTSHVFAAEPSQHVFYTGTNGHLIELWWKPGDVVPNVKDLNLRSGAPLPSGPSLPGSFIGSVASHVFGNTQHVFYLTGGHLIELWWAASDEDPQWRSLTAAGRAPFARCPPASHVFNADRTQHVFYVADNGQLIEFLWSSTPEPPQVRNLSERSQAPLPFVPGIPVSVVNSHVFEADGIQTQHVFYLTDFGNQSGHGFVSELSWGSSGEDPTFVGLNVASGGAPPAVLAGARLINHVFKAERTRHVFYTSVEGSKELWHLVP